VQERTHEGCRATRSVASVPPVADDRSRTYAWDDPFALRDEMAGRSGLELMQMMAAGELPPPPIAKTLGFRLVEAGPGHALFECEPAEYHYNPIGVVHAGLAMTLMDSAMGLAFVTTLEQPVGWTTLEVKASFTRALTVETGLIRCTGSVIHPGRRVATIACRHPVRSGTDLDRRDHLLPRSLGAGPGGLHGRVSCAREGVEP